MMTDVDAITRRFIPSFALHLIISFILRQVDRINIPQAYRYEYFKENSLVRFKPTSEAELLTITVLTLEGIHAYTGNTVTNLTPLSTPSPLPLFHIQSSSVLIIAPPSNTIPSITTILATNFKHIEYI